MTFEDHAKELYEVLSCHREAGFSLKLSSGTFFKEEVCLLGHMAMPENLLEAQKNVDALQTFLST